MPEITTVIAYYPTKENVARKGATFIERIFIKPGRNALTKEQYDLLKSNARFIELVKKQAISILSEEVGEENQDELVNLKGLNLTQAREAISLEKSVETLEKWREAEPSTKVREKVINEISKQIKLIKSGEL